MLNETDLKQENATIPLLRLSFRSFFLFGSLFALFAMFMWLLVISGVAEVSPLNGVHWWHSHEMLFGFVPAIIAGFLLTAVQTWTSVPSIKGNKLLCLLLVWFAARFLIFVDLGVPLWLVMSIDLSFLPLTGYFLAQPLLKIKQYRNMIFLPVLTLMALANFFTYLPLLGITPALTSQEFAGQGLHAMIILTALLVALLGGRVIPMFTANGTNTPKVLPILGLEASALLSLFIIFLFFITGLTQFSFTLGIICFCSALLNGWRILRWRFWVTFKTPLVWVLHFTMMFVPIGLMMLAVHFIFNTVTLSTALHSITVGVIGGMILAMMSRVSLGHTGRKLIATPIMIAAFIAIILAAIVRSLGIAMLPEFTTQFWLLSGMFWCVAYGGFVWVFLPILSAPRVDGRPG
jgi:uncharacterized protein involved in response to NO